MDPLFRVEVISKTPNPQQAIYVAAHQDYSEGFAWDEQYVRVDNAVYEKDDDAIGKWPDEEECGDRIVKNLLAGGRGHYGPLEHPQIVLNCGWFPHSTMQQIRTHRVGISFDVQSFRYTGQRIIDVAEGKQSVEEVFYLRPLGVYTSRQGDRYEYDEIQRNSDREWCFAAADKYRDRIKKAGFSEEHARGLIPFDVRQHWVMSVNVRSLMHLLDLRWKADAQLECQWLCDLIWPHFEAWVPQVAAWYKANRAQKARLAP